MESTEEKTTIKQLKSEVSQLRSILRNLVNDMYQLSQDDSSGKVTFDSDLVGILDELRNRI